MRHRHIEKASSPVLGLRKWTLYELSPVRKDRQFSCMCTSELDMIVQVPFDALNLDKDMPSLPW